MQKIYNTLTRSTQEFQPIEAGKVRLYVCGMTVYDLCHLGHARVLVVFDVVTRWLRASGYEVTYVRNITDIDDKIIQRAGENKESVRALTDRYIAAMHEDSAALGVQAPDHEPRATEYVGKMLEMIGALEKNGYAYLAANRDVCFAVRKFADYGRLSGKSLEDLRAGERVEVATGKDDPLDFVLWKHARDEEPAEVKWDSAWGSGRPGWHIECSAMSTHLLGQSFDIHGGGQDLQFPHHDNEIAQSEGARCAGDHRPFVNYWMHNGFVRVDDEKMSKSLGNFFTIREILKQYDAEVVRFFILRAHYRSPLNYSDVHLDDARAALTRLYTALKDFKLDAATIDWQNDYARRFRNAMEDDFATPEAVAVLFDIATELNRSKQPQLAVLLKALAGLLGLLQREPQQFLQGQVGTLSGLSTAEIEAQLAARSAAKKAKDYAAADAIRDSLLQAGIILEDGPQGTSWRRA